MRIAPQRENQSLTVSVPPHRGFTAAAGVGEALRSPAEPLNASVRSYFEPRFAHNFGDVLVHTDARSAESARAVNAPAYTIGRHLVVAPEYYQVESPGGRALMAHELAHVAQQGHTADDALAEAPLDERNSPREHQAQTAAADALAGAHTAGRALQLSPARISRADPELVRRTINLRSIVGSGIQFVPPNITDTRVGPVSVMGGLLGDRASRLNVIIGQNLTLRILAQQILPLWTTATPFTPPGAATPLPLAQITADDLARALAVYNQTYLPMPSMTRWQAGLRFPLPVEIDESTGVATLHPLQIQNLASAFDPTQEPLLDSGAQATAAPPAATLQTDVTAFLTQKPTALERGIHLGARALTNAMTTLPFLQEVFRQAGADSLEIALNFMDFLVNREIGILAAQRDGAAILAAVQGVLGTAPATPSTSQQERLTRATNMLNRVSGVTAQAPPEAFVNPCDPIRPLEWTDFQGPPTGTHSAFTAFDFPPVVGPAGTRLRAVFSPHRSWVRRQFANPTDGTLNGCDAKVRRCETFFPPGTTGGNYHLSPLAGCPAAIAPDPSIEATSFSDCSGKIATECQRVAVQESQRLLRHEKLHFDLACVMVGKANASLAAGRAMTTVRPALTARTNALTSQYDTQTNHGCNAVPQANWVSDVSDGLPNEHVP